MNEPPYSLAMGWILSLLFYEDGFPIKLPSKVDMPLNEETKEPHLSSLWRLPDFFADAENDITYVIFSTYRIWI